MTEQTSEAVSDGPFLTTREAARFLKLKPNTSYSVSSTTAGSNVAVTLTEGGSGYQSDSAGVLSFVL